MLKRNSLTVGKIKKNPLNYTKEYSVAQSFIGDYQRKEDNKQGNTLKYLIELNIGIPSDPVTGEGFPVVEGHIKIRVAWSVGLTHFPDLSKLGSVWSPMLDDNIDWSRGIQV